MTRRTERTGTPGVYRRVSVRDGKEVVKYAVVYRVRGRQKWESAPNMTAAKQLLAKRRSEVTLGLHQDESKLTFKDYASDWIETYDGGNRTFRETTRENYRQALELHVYPELGKYRLADITPTVLRKFLRKMSSKTYGEDKTPLSDSTVRNIYNPIRACLSTAVGDGLILTNPTREVKPPKSLRAGESPDERVRAFTAEQLANILSVTPPKHQDLFQLLATTGLRISEAIALTWADVELDGSNPHVHVQRAFVQGLEHAPKSSHGFRRVPIPFSLVQRLRRRRGSADRSANNDLVFADAKGGPLRPDNLRNRVLRPVFGEAGVEWAGGSFHIFRHTYATMQFARGANLKQVQHALGHHSAAFTLETYVHLLDGDHIEPLELASFGVNVEQDKLQGSDSAIEAMLGKT